MDIKLTESRVVSQKYEKHYKILINGKEVYVSKWFSDDEFGFEGDTEIFKGQELLTEEEQEAILNFVNETLADKGE
jgi:hypothetical protein